MKLDLVVPEIKTSSNSKPISLSVSEDLDRRIKEIKRKREDSKLFNELHRQALEQIVKMFETGEVFKKAS